MGKSYVICLRTAVILLAGVLASVRMQATDYVKDVKVIGGTASETSNLRNTLTAQGWTFIDQDLNANASGDYIYLLYKTESSSNNVNYDYVTDFLIDNSNNAPTIKTYQGRTYRLVPYDGGARFKSSGGDLNSGTMGANIHLYYTTDIVPSNCAVTAIYFDTTQSGAVGLNGSSSGYSLNTGTPGKRIFMHVVTAATTTGHEPVSCLELCEATSDGIHVRGWAYDPDAPCKSIPIWVELRYANGNPLKMLKLETDRFREDVNNQESISGLHGFESLIPIEKSGTYIVSIYASDLTGDGEKLQVGSTQTVNVRVKLNLDHFDWPMSRLALNYQYESNDSQLVQASIPAVAYATTVNKVDDTHISFVGLVLDGNEEVTVEVNLTDGSFAIPDGTVFASTDYGHVAIFNMSEEGAPIKGTISEEGIWLDDMWSDRFVDGDKKDSKWSSPYILKTAALVVPNALMTCTYYNGENTDDVYVMQETGKAMVFNFAGMGIFLKINMKEDNLIEIPYQLVLKNDYDYYAYPVDEDGSKTFNTITGTGSGATLTFNDDWTICSNNGGGWFGVLSQTSITLTDGSVFNFPTIDDVAAIPAQPKIIKIENYNPQNGFGALHIDVPNTNQEGNLLKESKLYYKFYSKLDGVVAPITLQSDLYKNLNEDLIEIPYTQNDNYDFDISDDGYKKVYLNFDFSGYSGIGIQSIYYGGGERNETAINWMNVDSSGEELEPELVKLPEGAEVQEWAFTGYKEVNGELTPESKHIHVSFVGDQVYFQGLSDFKPDNWIVGMLANSDITIPAKEYLGEYYFYDPIYVYTQDMNFTYNVANDQIIANTIAFDLCNEGNVYFTESFKNVELTLVKAVPGIPATPSVTNVKLYDTSYTYIELNVPTTITNGNEMLFDNLYYMISIERFDGSSFDYTFKTDTYYYLENDLVWMPYNYTDDSDIYQGGHKIYIYDDNVTSWKIIKVQSKYECSNSEIYYSDFGIYDLTKYWKESGDIPFVLLADDADNSSTISSISDGQMRNVKLKNRIFFMDGTWKTLCLPFDLATLSDTPLEGATIMELNSTTSGLVNGVTTLNFDEVTSLEAGKPYLLKWEISEPDLILNNAEDPKMDAPVYRSISNPEFWGVTISTTEPTVVTFEGGQLVGNFSPVDIYTSDKSILYLGANDMLYYPWDNDMTEFCLGAFRAYFYSSLGGAVNDYLQLNLGDDIITIIPTISERKDSYKKEPWYDLNGHMLPGNPTQRGLYINKGKKMLKK